MTTEALNSCAKCGDRSRGSKGAALRDDMRQGTLGERLVLAATCDQRILCLLCILAPAIQKQRQAARPRHVPVQRHVVDVMKGFNVDK